MKKGSFFINESPKEDYPMPAMVLERFRIFVVKTNVINASHIMIFL